MESDPTFMLRTMFGAKALYLGGKIMLCVCTNKEPWQGLLVCTDRERHAALTAEFPMLAPHTILPKWLYLPNTHPKFEAVAERLVKAVRQRDPRIGVDPQPRRSKTMRS